MCYRKCDCPHYVTNMINGNHNACGNCEYIKEMEKYQKFSRIALGIVALLFLTTTYLLF